MDKRLQFVARRTQRSHQMNRRRSRSVQFRDSLSRCPLHRIGQIILHGEAPLPIAGVKMLPAIAGRAAIVRLQGQIALRQRRLREPDSPKSLKCRRYKDKAERPGFFSFVLEDYVNSKARGGDLMPSTLIQVN